MSIRFRGTGRVLHLGRLRAAMLAACMTATLVSAQVVAPMPVPAAASAPAPAPLPPLPLADPQTTRFAQAMLQQRYAPAAAAFAASGLELDDAVQALCRAPAAEALAARSRTRQAWSRFMRDWTRLSAVPLGALLNRQSETRLDFHPLRVSALDKVIAQAPSSGRWEMDRVGAQARGLSAMEHLLWTRPAAPATPACAYLVALAGDARNESDGLAREFAEGARRPMSDAEAGLWLNEYVNQWLSGMARLRWRDLELPARSWGMAQAPRAASQQTSEAWATRWQALREQSVGSGARSPEPSLSGLLRQRQMDALADALERDVRLADQALAGATPTAPVARLLEAARRVDTITHTISHDAGRYLQIQLEFTAEDGD
jgi:hypothetical protein